MQRVIFQPQSGTQSQATRVQSGHVTDMQTQAFNDDNYRADTSVMKLVLSVLANVIGGSVMILGMFLLPLIMERLLLP